MRFSFGLKADFFQFASANRTSCILSNFAETARATSLRLKNISLSSGTQVFKALADESRLRIINLLLFKTELSISDIELILDFTQTKTARLMGVLKNAGLVQNRRIDYWVFYRIKEEAAELLEGLLELMEKDSVLQKDIRACEVMESNRELSQNKIESRRYRP